MCLQEFAHTIDGSGFQLRGILPGIYGHFGIRRQRSDVDASLVGVRGCVVRQHEHRRLAVSGKVSRHAENEVRPHTVEVVQVLLDGYHWHLGPPLAELLGPAVAAMVPHDLRILRTVADRLTYDRRDNAVRGPLHQLECEGAADAVAEEGELTNTEVVHEPELVLGESIPWAVDRNRASGFAVGGIALVHGNNAEVSLELLHRVDDGVGPVDEPRVQSAARNGKEREAGTDLLVTDAHAVLLVEARFD